MENPSKARQVRWKDWLQWIIPVFLGTWVTVMTWFHTWIEEVYSIKIYPYIAIVQRTITGWIPFSIGDILYLALSIWLLLKITRTIIAIFKRRITKHKTIQRTFRLARFLLWTYIVFNLVWGWNYHRKGLDHQLQLPVGSYSSLEVKAMMDEVIDRMNENRLLISKDTLMQVPGFSQLKDGAINSYRSAAAKFPFLRYDHPSVKKTMYSAMAQYMGFTGYYNPFTGEAQLRTHWPEVLKPFILCHEIGHQVGYAKENEASFAGYLAGSASADPYFRYSTYLDLYDFVKGRYKLMRRIEKDTAGLTAELIQYNQRLDTLVRYDRRMIAEYFYRSKTLFSEEMSSVVMSMYDQYLKANAQAAGLKSYNDVVSLLIAYRRKFGRI